MGDPLSYFPNNSKTCTFYDKKLNGYWKIGFNDVTKKVDEITWKKELEKTSTNISRVRQMYLNKIDYHKILTKVSEGGENNRIIFKNDFDTFFSIEYGPDILNKKILFIYTKKFYPSPKVNGISIYSVNTYDLKAMVNWFIKDLEFNLSKFSSKKFPYDLSSNYISTKFVNLPKDVLALSRAKDNNKNIVIEVDPIKWEQASLQRKWYLFYHELGHDILNFDHGEGGKMMFNYIDREYNWRNFQADKQYMFENYINSLSNSFSNINYIIPKRSFPNRISTDNLYDWRVSIYDEDVYVHPSDRIFEIWYSKKFNNFSLIALLGYNGKICKKNVVNDSFLNFKVVFDDETTFNFNSKVYITNDGDFIFTLKRYSSINEREFKMFINKLSTRSKAYLEIPNLECYFEMSLKGSSKALRHANLIN